MSGLGSRLFSCIESLELAAEEIREREHLRLALFEPLLLGLVIVVKNPDASTF
jgi:hypothetical protein